ncbi:valine--tRNA ligase [Tieghemiomyces parasiticus]|uniref:Probable valine--tRNA ligase, cytoplasmic n=1 Tax=Tieghemiomyces parasiticus TaxID=78921 RepID=A0A9W8AGS6_9FUNG|nr:valine--tRNA ligase [Tieghemiomyces parasiticus]
MRILSVLSRTARNHSLYSRRTLISFAAPLRSPASPGPRRPLSTSTIVTALHPTCIAMDPAGKPTPSNPQGDQPASLSKNAEKNEAKRQAKLAKFAAKQAAQAAAKGDNVKDEKKKPAKKEAAPAAAKPAEPAFVNTTPKGAKKDMGGEMAGAYHPPAVEAAWYSWWEQQSLFQPRLTADGQVRPEGTFVIPIPPPNVTGSLHIGHALTIAIQDTLIRWERMRGKTVLYNPGMDHAGISTQAVVENMLWKEQGLTRHDVGREAFLEKVWEWKDKFGGQIQNQLRRLGASFDWTRSRFTMDPDMTEAVNEHFIRLFEDGTIYRANRLVNWCVRLNTALSNLEVENKELSGSTYLNVPGYGDDEKFQFGVLVCFAYEVEGSDERLVVATTRVETMLGDTAIAVHPDDARYTHLHGKFVRHPFVADRRIPIITDAEIVDMEFGTGAVKITPAHDLNDYEVGKRHNLDFINILNDDGTFNENAGSEFAGQKRFHVRRDIVKALKAKGLLVETRDNPMTVPTCVKTGDIIEPLMKPQWYVACGDMAQAAMKAVRDGELTITPAVSEADWFRWLEKIQDWCISRQLWWGHRVPAYAVRIAGAAPPGLTDMHYWVVGRTEAEAQAAAEARFPGQTFTLERDPDVLDTWFSSALWPFSIHGWPRETADLERFYPASLLETGWDILFFWVARMVMVGIKLTGQVPFKEVLCHAMIRDAHGRKMSKSLGNVIDPLDVIQGITLDGLHSKLLGGNLDPREVKKATDGQTADYPRGIPECGTDALRFALCAYTSTGRDLNLDILRVEGYRKFCNKLWNATRFALMKLDGGRFQPWSEAEATAAATRNQLGLTDRWILHKLNQATAEVNNALTERNFMAATTAVHRFWLYELCDVYIEAIKPVCDSTDPALAAARNAAQNTLYTCLERGLKLLHPFMPFITEELYQRLPRRPMANPTSDVPCDSIMVTSFPQIVPAFHDATADRDFDLVCTAARAARSLMTDYGLLARAQLYYTTSTPALHDLLTNAAGTLRALIRGCEQLTIVPPGQAAPAGCAVTTVSDECTAMLLVRGMVDIDGEVNKLRTKLDKTRDQLAAWEKRIQVPNYEKKVRVDVRETNAAKMKSLEAEIETLSDGIANFLSLKD